MPMTSLDSATPHLLSAPRTAAPSLLRRHDEPPEPSVEDIAADAYERYVARGYEDGHDLDDWLAAEQELRARARLE